MPIWKTIRRLLEDPPPAFVFEFSPGGIAVARHGRPPQIGWLPLDPDVLSVSPVHDNVVRPQALLAQIRAAAPGNGNRVRPAALILPDYSARVAVLDFDSFPSSSDEQMSLVRFRMKKTVPFDLDSAVLAYHASSVGGRHEVVVAVAAMEIVARYEAAVRGAGLQPGLITTSMLAAVDLLRHVEGITVTAKLSGVALSVAVTDGRRLKLLRSVELPAATAGEVLELLHPTFAYVEDELGQRPRQLLLCGFGESTEDLRQRAEAELGVASGPLRSRWGTPDGTNAGLFGYLEAAVEG